MRVTGKNLLTLISACHYALDEIHTLKQNARAEKTSHAAEDVQNLQTEEANIKELRDRAEVAYYKDVEPL